jgi:hypothetical protein
MARRSHPAAQRSRAGAGGTPLGPFGLRSPVAALGQERDGGFFEVLSEHGRKRTDQLWTRIPAIEMMT